VFIKTGPMRGGLYEIILLKKENISIFWIQGLQEKFCKAEQACFGAPGTGWDFSKNGYFQLFLVYLKKKSYRIHLDFYESLPVVLLESKSSIFREVSACPRDPKTVWFRLAKFLLEARIFK
jgi:hypothetical protein